MQVIHRTGTHVAFMKNLRGVLRHHLPFLIIVPLLIIAMTWPTIIHVFDRDGFWLAQENIDSNMLFWDAWYFERLITGQADYFFTDLLFHPDGVSLAFHNFSLPHMAALAALKTILPPANAFNLTYLLLCALVAASGYLYLNYLFRDRWIALFGSIVFGMSGFILTRPAQIHISFISTIPLSLYCFHRAVLEENWKLMLLAGLFAGATAFVGMYTLVCLLIILTLYILGFALNRWRTPRYWLSIALLLSVIAAFVFLRVYPMISDPAGLSGALAKNEGFEVGTDLMWYFVNYKHPVLTPLFHQLYPIVDKPGWDRIVYLGYIPLALLALALWKRKTRRLALPWLAVALIFLILRLGSTLTLNSTNYENVFLPKYYLSQAIPAVFKPFWTVDAFLAGALLPLAILACIGLTALLHSVRRKLRLGVILLLAGAVAFEYYQVQRPFELPQGSLDFIDWFGEQDDQESIRLINLPMGGQYSKFYAFHQTFHGYPHAEGRPTRTPPRAFDAIEGNLLLREWRAGKAYNCLPGNQSEFLAARKQMLDFGFTHILLHHALIQRQALSANFVNIPAVYSDRFVSVYRVEDLRQSCNFAPTLWNQDGIRLFKSVEEQAILPLQQFALLGIFPSAYYDSGAERYYHAFLYSLRDSIPVHEADIYGESSGSAEAQAGSTLAALTSNRVALTVFNPAATDRDTVDNYKAWLARHFKACARLVDTETAVIEIFLRPDYPCELVLSDAPLAVDYDNGIRLGNLLSAVDLDKLELAILWKRLPAEAHAFSVQFFAEDGTKALGQDFVFHGEALDQYEIDLSGLAPGHYAVKLIVYNYATGVSLSGADVLSQTRFERELDLTRITIETKP